MNILANEQTKALIKSMIQKGKEPHSIVITGEKGLGKKTVAKYIAAALMCKSGNGYPCGECRSCRMIEHNTHPDFITAQANDNGNYQVDTIRALVSDAVIKPNDSDIKVYLIPDMDRSIATAVQVQNILLKLIEEPPDHCVIILTASSKEIFLQTILSRVLNIRVQNCSIEQAEQYLTSTGQFGQDDIIRAVSCCHGNIGKCIEFLNGTELPEAYECAKACIDAMTKRDEYLMLKSFFATDGKKAVFRQTLIFLSEMARDVCLLCLGIKTENVCYNAGTEKLSKIMHSVSAQKFYDLVNDYIKKIDSNCNLTLTINSITAQIYNLLY